MLKFSSRVKLVSETGREVCFIHAEEAERLHRNGQALHRNHGKLVRELMLPDSQPKNVTDHISSNSCGSVYLETLNGGSRLLIETNSKPVREVTTLPCLAYKMKSISRSLRPLYQTVIRENLLTTAAAIHTPRSRSKPADHNKGSFDVQSAHSLSVRSAQVSRESVQAECTARPPIHT